MFRFSEYERLGSLAQNQELLLRAKNKINDKKYIGGKGK